MSAEINDLPDEILEFILSYLPPYKDFENCQIVCKRWNSAIKNVVRRSRMSLHKGLVDFRLCWKSNYQQQQQQQQQYQSPTIAGRFSHAAVIHQSSMYIFGGGSSSDTTFNDLWRFDLSKREWIRPITMGSYPSPKGSATMCCYNDQLILFGGWRYPSLHPPYQQWCLFDELHLYDIKENRWFVVPSTVAASNSNSSSGSSSNTNVNTNSYFGPPPMAGHSATIHRNQMIVFGGYQINNEINSNSNDIWCLNLDTFTWSKPETSNLKPPPRYGQYQIYLNDTNLLIVGGCGGPNNMFSDAWLLNMSNSIWKWTSIPIKNKKWSATYMWCNPACRVGTKLVVLGPTPNLPSDFHMLRQKRHEANHNSLNNHRHDNLMNPRGRIGDNVLRLNDQNFRIRLNENLPANNDNNNNNNNVGLNRAVGLNNINIDEDQNYARERQIQQAERQPQNFVEDEAASRLQRNLALRCREDDAKLPKRFDEPFEDRFRMAAFKVQPLNKSRNSSRERQMERVRRMEEKMNALRNSRRNNQASGSNSGSDNSSNGSGNNSNPNRNNENNLMNIGTNETNNARGNNSGNSNNNKSNNNNSNSNDNKKKQEQQQHQQPNPKRIKRNCLGMFICDISNILSNEPYLEWIEYKNYGILSGAPERLILSTIVHGNGELIMFGGVHKESLSESIHKVSNTVHFLAAPKDII